MRVDLSGIIIYQHGSVNRRDSPGRDHSRGRCVVNSPESPGVFMLLQLRHKPGNCETPTKLCSWEKRKGGKKVGLWFSGSPRCGFQTGKLSEDSDWKLFFFWLRLFLEPTRSLSAPFSLDSSLNSKRNQRVFFSGPRLFWSCNSFQAWGGVGRKKKRPTVRPDSSLPKSFSLFFFFK